MDSCILKQTETLKSEMLCSWSFLLKATTFLTHLIYINIKHVRMYIIKWGKLIIFIFVTYIQNSFVLHFIYLHCLGTSK